MHRFDLDGDGKLDPIELATAKTYYEELWEGEDGDTFLDELDELLFDEDESDLDLLDD